MTATTIKMVSMVSMAIMYVVWSLAMISWTKQHYIYNKGLLIDVCLWTVFAVGAMAISPLIAGVVFAVSVIYTVAVINTSLNIF